MINTKGKTYEQIYSKKKAKHLKEARRKIAIAQMKKQRKAKTHIEICGKEKAEEMAKKMNDNLFGENNPNYNREYWFVYFNKGILIEWPKYL